MRPLYDSTESLVTAAVREIFSRRSIRPSTSFGAGLLSRRSTSAWVASNSLSFFLSFLVSAWLAPLSRVDAAGSACAIGAVGRIVAAVSTAAQTLVPRVNICLDKILSKPLLRGATVRGGWEGR